MIEPLTVYIGYDPREHDAYLVCRTSLLRHASRPVRIVKLDRALLEHAGIYYRPWHFNGRQPVDDRDGRPFSTDFAFSRFMVPMLQLYQGMAVFCDCDFLFTADIHEVLESVSPSDAVSVVKHAYMPTESEKMDGMLQGVYLRKNWSSFVVWNCAHAAHRELTAEDVVAKPGRWLHAFSWLLDEHIGALAHTWNYLSGVDKAWPHTVPPKAIHFTLGGPWFENHRHHPYSDLWLRELHRIGRPDEVAIQGA